MSADHDLGGDYGYDMVHEVQAGLRTPVTAVRKVVVSGTGPGRGLDQDGDYGYDQAHDG